MNIPKAIFLDIDGVIATLHEFNMTRYAKTYLHQYDIYPFNPQCVKVLNETLKLTKAEIILSSDWRTFFSEEELEDIFAINNVASSPVAFTPDLSKQYHDKSLSEIRTLEIKSFLRDNEIDRYVVLDDLDMSEGFSNRFVLCESQLNGMRQTGVLNKIISSFIDRFISF